MGGGLIQLVATGAQDVFLTGNPQITFWKAIYNRHTNFAIEAISQTFDGQSDWGGSCVATLSRNGDMIHKSYLQVQLKNNSKKPFHYTRDLGHALIRNVELEIGGQTIDRHDGQWLHYWNELTLPEEKYMGYNRMIGNYDFTTTSRNNNGSSRDHNGRETNLETIRRNFLELLHASDDNDSVENALRAANIRNGYNADDWFDLKPPLN